MVWRVGLELHKKINCSNAFAFHGHDVYISKYEHVLHVFKPVYLFVHFIMSYLSAPEPTLWSALSARDKSTAEYTDPCPPCNPSLTLLSHVPLLSCLFTPPLSPPVTSLLSELGFTYSPFPGRIPPPRSSSLLLPPPPAVLPSLLAFSFFL